MIPLFAVLASTLWAGEATTKSFPSRDDSARHIDRVFAFGQLWGRLKFLHPRLGRAGLDWDAALVETLPAVETATTTEDYARAVQTLLERLGDPLTQLESPARPTGARLSRGTEPPFLETRADKVLLITVRALPDGSLGNFRSEELIRQLAMAEAVVFDFRANGPASGWPLASLFDREPVLAQMLTTSPVLVPGKRSRTHLGYVEIGVGRASYETGYALRDFDVIQPGPEARERPVVFLCNADGGIARRALALRDAGKAALLTEGPVADDGLASTASFPLPEGLRATVRVDELVVADGSSEIKPDEVLATTGAASVARALARLREPPPRPRLLPTASVSYQPATEKIYAPARLPTRAERLLAVAKFWTVVHYFFPYRHLMEENWEQAVRAALPGIANASDLPAYVQAVAQLAVKLDDSHVGVSHPVMTALQGQAYPPFWVRFVEGVPVVGGLVDVGAAQAAGVAVGDEILTIDGRPVAERISALQPFTSASTVPGLLRKLAYRSVAGAEASVVTLTLRGADGRARDTRVMRKKEYAYGRSDRRWRDGPVYQRRVDDIGYIDLDRLDRLQSSELDAMFAALADTKAIVFDMRGYPWGLGQEIAARFARATDFVRARFTDMRVGAGETMSEPRQETWLQHAAYESLPTPRYAGRTVMLIDERAQSSSEHIGMLFRCANGTAFVGSATAGANGSVTRVTLPGGISITMSGQGVSWPDGRQLQRVGLEPDVKVQPTLAGLRQGRDEVLERAVEWLNAELSTPARPRP